MVIDLASFVWGASIHLAPSSMYSHAAFESILPTDSRSSRSPGRGESDLEREISERAKECNRAKQARIRLFRRT